MHCQALTASVLALSLALLTTACSGPEPTPTPTPPETTETAEKEAPTEPSSMAASQPADVKDRVAAATARLESSEGGKLVAKSIERHGGLEAWYGGGAISFNYAYRPTMKTKGAKVSTQTIEISTSRAYHDITEPSPGVIAWDGEKAWSKIDDKFSARFWALTPYYFVSMPFVLADPGVSLQKLTPQQDDPVAAGLPEGTHVVKVTFEAGTGDAPDDYYVVYLKADDHTLLGLRYVVSWKPFTAKAGIAHTPEKLLLYTEPVTSKGATFFKTQTFHAYGENKKGAVITNAAVTDLALGASFDSARLVMPEGAVIDDSLDGASE